MAFLFESIAMERIPFEIRRLSINEYHQIIDLGILYGDNCELIRGLIVKQGFGAPGRTETQLRPFTVREYHGLIEAGFFRPDERVELIGGYLHPITPKHPRHAETLRHLTACFYACAVDQAMIRLQDPITLPTARSEPEPDLVLARPRQDGYVGRHPGPSDVLLIVEIADSSLVFDSLTKSSVYAAANIPDYWIINLVDNRLDVYRDPVVHADGTAGYRTRHVYGPGQTATPLLLPACRVAVNEVIPGLFPEDD